MNCLSALSRRDVRVTASALSLLAASGTAHAVAIDAGDYVPAAPGTQLGLLYLQHSTAEDLYVDSDKIADDARLNVEVAMPRYVGFAEVAGMTFDYQLLVPWVDIDAGGSVESLGDAGGMGDPILVSTLWLVNRPETSTYFGITPYIWLPLGNYDREAALNTGENRWKFAMQAVVSKGLGNGFTGELSGDVQWATKNDEFAGNSTRKQDALYDIQGFLRYTINPTNEVNFRLRYLFGGENEVDGYKQDDETRTLSGLLTWAHWLDSGTQIMLQGGRDFDVENGFREDSRLQVRLLQVF